MILSQGKKNFDETEFVMMLFCVHLLIFKNASFLKKKMPDIKLNKSGHNLVLFQVRMTLRNDIIIVPTKYSLSWLNPFSGTQLLELECSYSTPFILNNDLQHYCPPHPSLLGFVRYWPEVICFAISPDKQVRRWRVTKQFPDLHVRLLFGILGLRMVKGSGSKEGEVIS